MVDNPLILFHRLRYYKLPLLYTHRYPRRRLIPLIPLHFCLPAPSWWCFALAVIRGKRHGSSISLVIQVCKFVCLLGAEFEKV